MIDQTTSNGAAVEVKTKDGASKKKKEPKAEAEIPPEVLVWKGKLDSFAREMASLVKEAQKERKTWLSTHVDSNQNLQLADSSQTGETCRNSESRAQIISDDAKMLFSKIE